MIDIHDYCQYYSIEKLVHQIENRNLDIISIQNLNNNDLFQIAIENGFDDLAEYLFIYCGIEYDQKWLLDSLTIQLKETPVDDSCVTIHGFGGNNGVNLEYWSTKENGKQKIIYKLLSLRKYSTMKYENNKFLYKFNKKYISNI